jgi:SAM-dependent methyltransferase
VVTIPGSGERFDLDRPGAVAAWNRALNRRFGMAHLRAHRSRIVRRIEARRRRRVAGLVGSFGRALDLGSEDGSLVEAWREGGAQTVLLDLDPAMLRRARGPGVAADACRLPLRAESFDLVVVCALLEHLVDPAECLAEVVRVLRPGGRIVAWVPWDAAVVPLKRWGRRLGFRLGPLHEGQAPGHLRSFDRAGLRRLFVPFSRALRITLDPFSLGYSVEARI